MIVDDLVQAYPGMKIEDVPIIQVPFPVFPYDDSDGEPGLLWTETRLAGLLPLENRDGFASVIGTLAVPPYPATILIGPQPEWGCTLVVAQPMDESKRDRTQRQLNDIVTQLRAQGHAVPSPDLSTLRWEMTALTFGVCGRLDGYLITKTARFHVGDHVLSAMPLLYQMERKQLATLDDAALQQVTLYTLWGDSRARASLLGLPQPNLAETEALVRQASREDLLSCVNGHIIDGDATIRTVVTAFSLMQAKNVVLDPVTPPFARAARRRGEKPPVRYHVLKVRPLTRRRAGVAGGLHPEPVAIHWVRGHLKTYTAERPLLGRFSGTYYWQAHIAGRDRTHRVDKDYEVHR